jgi:hypothetical protein
MADAKEQCVYINLCIKARNITTERHNMLQTAFGDEALYNAMTSQRFLKFKHQLGTMTRWPSINIQKGFWYMSGLISELSDRSSYLYITMFYPNINMHLPYLSMSVMYINSTGMLTI